MKHTKHKLLSSIATLFVCLAMFIGSTYAWFTDSASTGVNKIQAGDLDIVLEYYDSSTTSWKEVNDTTKLFDDNALWEPGHTEVAYLHIKNAGTLDLKYKMNVNIPSETGSINQKGDPFKLSDFLVFGKISMASATSFYTKDADGRADARADAGTTMGLSSWTEAGNLYAAPAPSGSVNEEYVALVIYMPETVGNVANHKKGTAAPSIQLGVNIVATQLNSESDSYGNDYDKDATTYPDPVYPLGFTEDSFDANRVAVDDKGTFYSSFQEAMDVVGDNGAIYLKENGTVDFATHLNVTKNITIYGNGTDFSGKDISIGTYAAPQNTETTVNIYNAKNLVVWGQPDGTREDVWNVNFYNCSNNNYNFLMYRGNETGKAKLNLTMTNCSAEGFYDSIVHTSADGSIVIKNCTFKNNCAPINIAHKQTGSLKVSVQDSKFVNCGKVNPDNDYFAPARFVNNSQTGSLNVSLKNNTFTGTVGTNGDILLGDYRTGKASHKVTAEIVTTDPVMVKSSQNSAYSYAGGTIVIPVVEAASQEELVSAIENSEIGSVKLGSGNYTLYNVENTKTTNTSLTVEGAGKDSTVFTVGNMAVTDANSEGSSDYSYEGSEVTFKDLTVSVGTGNYKGFVRAKSLYFENCKIVGRGSYWGVGKVVFKNCEFADNAGDYNLWTYAGTDFTFEGCTFNSSDGKFVNAYKEQRVDSKLDFINCQFNYTGSGTPTKPAVCLKSYTEIIWNVTFTNCTSSAATDSGTSSNLYSIESGMNAGTTVKIDNSVVWENGAKK